MGYRVVRKGTNCEVEGCDGVVRMKGLCQKHGMALRRYGSVFGGKVNRSGVCRGCGKEFRLVKSGQGYCSQVCYKKSPKGRAAAYAATKAYRARNTEKVRAVGIFRRHPFVKGDKCLVCGSSSGLHRHHHNYKEKMDVTILCKDHHVELHSWDSN